LNTPKISRLDHLTIEVNDLNKAINFYTKILGLEERRTPEEVKSKGIRWLNIADNQALHLIEIPDMREPSSAHMALIVEDIESWEKYLTKYHIEIQSPKFNIYNAKRFFIKDPSGNRIEFLKRL
jgi:catechol 2,3-dioxygenase-like lactoylglutathione lyase family enzyme